MHALRLEGYAILVPFGENTRYDLVIERSVYLIPICDLAPRRLASLRVAPPQSGQHKQVRLAARYELARFDVY